MALIPKTPNLPKTEYTGLTFDNILADIKNKIKDNPKYNKYWGDFLSANAGRMILELFSYIVEQLGIRADWLVNEFFIDTAEQNDSLISLLKLIEYNPSLANCAQVEVRATTDLVYTKNIIMPYPFYLQATDLNGGTVEFELIKKNADGKFEYPIDVANGGYRSEFSVSGYNPRICDFIFYQGRTTSESYTAKGIEDELIVLGSTSIIKDSIRLYKISTDINGNTIYQEGYFTDSFLDPIAQDKDTFLPFKLELLQDGKFGLRFANRSIMITKEAYTITTGLSDIGFQEKFPTEGDSYVIYYRIGGGINANIIPSSLNTTKTFYDDGNKTSVSINFINRKNGILGTDAETLEEARVRGPQYISTLKRASSIKDNKYIFDKSQYVLKSAHYSQQNNPGVVDDYGYDILPLEVWHYIVPNTAGWQQKKTYEYNSIFKFTQKETETINEKHAFSLGSKNISVGLENLADNGSIYRGSFILNEDISKQFIDYSTGTAKVLKIGKNNAESSNIEGKSLAEFEKLNIKFLKSTISNDIKRWGNINVKYNNNFDSNRGWNPLTNTPTLASGIGDKGDYYTVYGFTNKGNWDALNNSPTLTSSIGTSGFYYTVEWATEDKGTWNPITNTPTPLAVKGNIYTVTGLTNAGTWNAVVNDVDPGAGVSALPSSAINGTYYTVTGLTNGGNWTPAGKGFHKLSFSGTIASTPTSLAAGTYYFKINGLEYNISVSAGSTFNALATLINSAITLNGFSCKFSDQALIFTNENVTGILSTCTVTAGTSGGSGFNLFTLSPNTPTAFSGFNTAIPGGGGVPSLLNNVGTAGTYYTVTAAGEANFGNGNITFDVGDKVYYVGAYGANSIPSQEGNNNRWIKGIHNTNINSVEDWVNNDIIYYNGTNWIKGVSNTSLNGISDWMNGNIAFYNGTTWQKFKDISEMTPNTTLNGVSDWKVGDIVLFNGSAWVKGFTTTELDAVNGWQNGNIAFYNGTKWEKYLDNTQFSNLNPNWYDGYKYRDLIYVEGEYDKDNGYSLEVINNRFIKITIQDNKPLVFPNYLNFIFPKGYYAQDTSGNIYQYIYIDGTRLFPNLNNDPYEIKVTQSLSSERTVVGITSDNSTLLEEKIDYNIHHSIQGNETKPEGFYRLTTKDVYNTSSISDFDYFYVHYKEDYRGNDLEIYTNNKLIDFTNFILNTDHSMQISLTIAKDEKIASLTNIQFYKVIDDTPTVGSVSGTNNFFTLTSGIGFAPFIQAYVDTHLVVIHYTVGTVVHRGIGKIKNVASGGSEASIDSILDINLDDISADPNAKFEIWTEPNGKSIANTLNEKINAIENDLYIRSYVFAIFDEEVQKIAFITRNINFNDNKSVKLEIRDALSGTSLSSQSLLYFKSGASVTSDKDGDFVPDRFGQTFEYVINKELSDSTLTAVENIYKQPIFITFDLWATVYYNRSFDPNVIKTNIIEKLSSTYNLLNMDFNQNVYRSEVMSIIHSVNGVESVIIDFFGKDYTKKDIDSTQNQLSYIEVKYDEILLIADNEYLENLPEIDKYQIHGINLNMVRVI